jgi:ADP-heptose:LPS heptosyltransferase
MAGASSPPARILICRTDNIGDVVLTLPLAAMLKRHLPGVQVDFLVRAYAAPVVRQCCHVDQVLTVDAHPDARRMFADGNYDTVIFAFPKARLAQAARRAGVKRRIGTSHRLYHWLYCNKLVHFSRVKSDLHEAQLNFRLLRPLGIDVTPALADIPALYGMQAPHSAQVELLRAEAPFNLILHPKSNGNAREWPLARFAELARSLGQQGALRIWVTGSKAEGELMAREAPQLFALPHVRNLCGTLDLAGLTALIGAADGLVANSTGPLHMGAALGRPVVGLFAPIKGMDTGRWAPLGVQAATLCGAQRCATCSKEACTCMAAIDVAAVGAVVQGWRRVRDRVAR